MSSGQWSSRSLGSPLKHKIFYGLIRCLGLGAAYPLLNVVVFYYSLLPSVRRRSRPYLTRRFPGLKGLALWRAAFRLNLSFGRVLLERAAMGITGRMQFSDPEGGEEQVRKLLVEGRGLLIVSAHVGAWQTGLGWLESIDSPVNIAQRRQEADVDRHYFEHRAAGRTPKIIDTSEPVAALAAMTAALLAGEIVCLMGDRVWHQDSLTVQTPFLGENILIPGAPFYLAAKLGAPLAVIFTRRSGPSQVAGKLWRVIRPAGLAAKNPATLKPLAEAFARCLEDYVAAEPYQFFNFYNLWDIGEEHGNKE